MAKKPDPMSFRFDRATVDRIRRLQDRYTTVDGQPLPAARVLRMALELLEEQGPPGTKKNSKKVGNLHYP